MIVLKSLENGIFSETGRVRNLYIILGDTPCGIVFSLIRKKINANASVSRRQRFQFPKTIKENNVFFRKRVQTIHKKQLPS